MLGRLRALIGQAPPDVQAVADVAQLLRVSQFRVFEIAHKEWFGRGIPERVLEPVFVKFLYSQSPPAWVRQFARNVLRLNERGEFDPRAFGLPPMPAETMSLADLDRWSLVLYASVLALIFFVVPALNRL